MGRYDLQEFADPECPICQGSGRWVDYSEDEWGMVCYIRCECTYENDPNFDKEKFKEENKI